MTLRVPKTEHALIIEPGPEPINAKSLAKFGKKTTTPSLVYIVTKELRQIQLRGRPPLLITNGTQIGLTTSEKTSMANCSVEELTARAEMITDVLRKCMSRPVPPFWTAG